MTLDGPRSLEITRSLEINCSRWDEMLAAVCRINANHFATRQLRDRSIVDAALLLLRNGSSPAPATETPGGGGGAPGEAADRQGGGICVAVAATADRVGALHRLATSWPGLLSVAFLSHNFTRDAALGLRALAAPGGSLPASPGRIALSLVPNRPSGARPYVRRGRGGLFGDLFPPPTCCGISGPLRSPRRVVD